VQFFDLTGSDDESPGGSGQKRAHPEEDVGASSSPKKRRAAGKGKQKSIEVGSAPVTPPAASASRANRLTPSDGRTLLEAGALRQWDEARAWEQAERKRKEQEEEQEAERNRHVRDLESKVELAEARVTAAEAKLKAATSAQTRAEVALGDVQAARDAAEATRDAAETRCGEAKEKAEALAADLARTRAETAAKAKELAVIGRRLLDETTRLRGDKARLEVAVKERTAELEQVKLERSREKEDVGTLQRRLQELEKELTEGGRAMELQHIDMEGRVKARDEHIARLYERIDVLEARGATGEELPGLGEEKTRMHQEKSRLEQENGRLQQENARLKQEKARLEQDLDSTSYEWNVMVVREGGLRTELKACEDLIFEAVKDLPAWIGSVIPKTVWIEWDAVKEALKDKYTKSGKTGPS
jgi:predicted nuclease with TOPRIM domain